MKNEEKIENEIEVDYPIGGMVEPYDIEREKELKQIKSQVSKAEIEISRLENEIKTIDELLSDPASYQSIINDKVTFAKYEQMKKQLDTEMTNWEALNFKLEKL